MRWLLVWLSCLCVLGCQPEPSGPKPLKVWTAFEGEELKQVTEICAGYNQRVEVLAVPFEGLKNKVLVAAPAGQGPDLIIGPQDWLGVFSAAKLLEPYPPATLQKPGTTYSQVALDGVTYDGKIYALPLLMEGLALYRNPQLAPRQPKDLADLKSYAIELQQGNVKGFYFDLRELYFSWPVFSGHGAHIFKANLEPGLTGPEGVQASTYLKELRQAGLIPLGAKNDFAKSMFLEGRLAMTLNGPWFLSEVRAKGTPYVIEPVPPGPSGPSRPFIGITGIMVNAQAERKEQAFALAEYLGSTQSQVKLALSSGRVPASRQAQAEAARDPEIGKDIQAFTAVVEQGVAMPNHPAANAVWEPMKQSLELITKGEVEPSEELRRTEQQIREKIERMVE